ncbi:MAG TPA: DNA-directed RNA polymerase subunit beta [Candidatus Azoamicus sp. OHIO2]
MINKTNILSYTDKKRLRVNFGEYEERLRIPHLYYIQLKSYYEFINKYRKNKSLLEKLLQKTFPICGNNENIHLDYLSYSIGTCIFTPLECKMRGLNYSAPLKIKVHLYNGIKKKVKKTDDIESSIHDVYLLDMPLMTERGTFIINGTERVIVSQLHKSPGLYFEIDKSRTVSLNKPFYVARIIPHKGSWLDFEFDSKDCLVVRIDKKKKIYVTTFLRSLDLDDQDILKFFLKKQHVYLTDDGANITVEKFDNICDTGKSTKENLDQYDKNKFFAVTIEKLFGNLIAYDIINKNNNDCIIEANTVIDDNIIKLLREAKINNFSMIHLSSKDYNTYMANTLELDDAKDKSDALIEFQRILKPGEPATKETAKYTLANLFFNAEKYDLSDIGRIKVNEKLKLHLTTTTLAKEDIIYTIKKLIDIKDDQDHIDDIDHLGNRRVKSIGEVLDGLFKLAFSRMEKSIKEKLSATDNQNIRAQDLINTKLISTSVREFFCSSQLSQFMDQTNPLSEITHKRRLSALGPGGLSRERAGFEVRDVHNTHYGRICPIETPEGPNIGLINSLTIYARTNKYGFLETPYIIVKNKKITDEIKYLTANDENETIIAQANANINDLNELQDDQVSCRFKSEFIMADVNKIQYIDISPKQIVSISTALIPFLEHNDANRALMGSNMQRQATPLLRAEKPLVGTGIEKIIAMDPGIAVVAKRSGVVKSVDSVRIIIQVDINEVEENEAGIDIYKLVKYIRSNQNTCINQKPLVKLGDRVNKSDIIADGPATDLGELALGQNLLVAFMPWNGYNFEDSIIVSEKLIKEHKLTSIHIEEFVCMVRDSKIGPEEITSDIPNINDNILKNLDEFGIVRIGTYVKHGDILVGKITKKFDSQITPEEKLLHAIFGEKALNVENTSLKVPAGIKGSVIDIQIFNRYGMEKDRRTLELENIKFQNEKNNYKDEITILKNEILNQINNLILDYNLIYKDAIIFDTITKMDLATYKTYVLKDPRVKWKIYIKKVELERMEQRYLKRIKNLEEKYKEGDDLPPGITKVIKISIAMKKKIQIGDKLSGRHGNKGVVSIISPVEDMPYLQNGETIDVILNPLGVPSRMNIGQVLETHLGWAMKSLGTKITQLLVNFDRDYSVIKSFVSGIYNIKKKNVNLDLLTKEEFREFLENLKDGVPVATPVFDGIKEKEIKLLLKLANLPESGKIILYDGKTGLPFDNEITVGYQYLMKLNHLIDDKMHARATGSYSLISQQPLGGKAQFGGQRFGEMEVWALEAYGAAYTLQEMLTVKSDDITGRTKIYKNIIDSKYYMDPGIPEAFNVLLKEILSLGLNIELEYEEV